MKEVFNSLEELMSNCATSKLKSLVSFVLGSNEYIQWDFVSCWADGDECWAEFTSAIEHSDLFRYLFCRIDTRGEYWYTFISEPHAHPSVRIPG